MVQTGQQGRRLLLGQQSTRHQLGELVQQRGRQLEKPADPQLWPDAPAPLLPILEAARLHCQEQRFSFGMTLPGLQPAEEPLIKSCWLLWVQLRIGTW